MQINWIKGKKGKEDRIITLTTSREEWFSIFKTSLLVNQLAINELKINGEKIQRHNRFFLEEAIINSIKMAKEGFDWADEKNIGRVKKWCSYYMVPFEKIEPELRRVIQTKLGDYKDGSN